MPMTTCEGSSAPRQTATGVLTRSLQRVCGAPSRRAISLSQFPALNAAPPPPPAVPPPPSLRPCSVCGTCVDQETAQALERALTAAEELRKRGETAWDAGGQ